MVYRKRALLRETRRGFTLMEIMVVVAIILVLVSLGGVFLFGRYKDSQKSAAKIQIKTLVSTVEQYTLDHNGTPPQSLDVLLQKDSSGYGPYLKSREAITDPWGRPYSYSPAGPNDVEPHISCQAPDGTLIGN